MDSDLLIKRLIASRLFSTTKQVLLAIELYGPEDAPSRELLPREQVARKRAIQRVNEKLRSATGIEDPQEAFDSVVTAGVLKGAGADERLDRSVFVDTPALPPEFPIARWGRPEDCEQIHALDRDAFDFKEDEYVSADHIRSVLQKQPTSLIVLVEGERVLGYTSALFLTESGHERFVSGSYSTWDFPIEEVATLDEVTTLDNVLSWGHVVVSTARAAWGLKFEVAALEMLRDALVAIRGSRGLPRHLWLTAETVEGRNRLENSTLAVRVSGHAPIFGHGLYRVDLRADLEKHMRLLHAEQLRRLEHEAFKALRRGDAVG